MTTQKQLLTPAIATSRTITPLDNFAYPTADTKKTYAMGE
jgi:hypothetical protein